MMQDWQLLREYVQNGSQAAFGALVERYVNLVYSICLREVQDPALAEDVTQVVFLLFAKKAPGLREGTVISGWLFNTSRFASKNALKQEARRRRREHKAAEDMMQERQMKVEDAGWRELEPLLDDALASLGAEDRHVILLRFFESRSMRETGMTLGISEDAARKRVSRAVERLKQYFLKQGVVVPVAALTTLVAEHSVQAAPASCIASVLNTASCVASGSVTASVVGPNVISTLEGTVKALLVAKVKATTVAAVGLSLAGTGAGGVVHLTRAQALDVQHNPPQRVVIPLRAISITSLTRRPAYESGRRNLAAKQSSVRLGGAPGQIATELPAHDSNEAILNSHLAKPYPAPQPVQWKRMAQASPERATSAQATSGRPAQDTTTKLTVGVGEIRLDGKISAINFTDKTFILSATSFTGPNGRTNKFTAPKTKTVRVSTQTLWQSGADSKQKLTFENVKVGSAAVVIGKDLGSGKELPARAIRVEITEDETPPPPELTAPPEAVLSANPPLTAEVTAPPLTPEILAGPATLDLQLGHTAAVHALAYSPDGKILLSGSEDRTVKLWDARNGQLLRTLLGDEGWVNGITFSADGETLVTSSRSGAVRLWKAPGGRWGAATVEQTLKNSDSVGPVVLSPNNKFLVTGGGTWNATMKVWDLEAGEVRLTLTQHARGVEALAFSPDGATLVSGSRDGTVKLWDTRRFTVKTTLSQHKGEVRSVAISGDGKFLATAGDDGTVKLWDMQTNQVIHSLAGHTGAVRSVAFSPTGAMLASADGTLRVWDVQTGELMQTLPGLATGPLVFAQDGQTLAGGVGTTVKMWTTQRWQTKAAMVGSFEIQAIAYAPDGKLLATGGWDRIVRLWDVQTGQLKRALTGHTERVLALAFAPDGKSLTSGSADNMVKLWDVDSGAVSKTLSGHDAAVDDVAFSPDGKTLATASWDKTVKLWNLESGRATWTSPEFGGNVRAVAFSPDGKRLAGGSADRTVQVWDAQTGAVQMTLAGHGQAVNSVAFSSDGTLLASGSRHSTQDVGELKLWDAQTGKLQNTVGKYSGPVASLAFLSGGRVVVGTDYNSVQLTDSTTGQTLWSSFPNYIGMPRCLAVAPDGKMMATAGSDGMVHLWHIGNRANVKDVATLLPLPTAPDALNAPEYLTFTPEGYYVGSTTADRYVRWRVGIEPFPAAAFKSRFFKPDLVQQALAGQRLIPAGD